MTEGRVPWLPTDEARATAADAGLPEFMAELSIFQVLLRHPRVARAVNDLLVSMLWDGALDPRLRELLIMRIGWLTASDYEWTQHWRIACGLGISADDLLGVRDWSGHDAFDARERAVLAAGWQVPASDDPVGLDRMGDHVIVGVGGGDLGEGELLAAPHGATVAQQIRALGRAGVLDSHRHGGCAGALVEVVVRPRGRGARGVHHRCDHPTVEIDAVVGEVFAEGQPDRHVVGLVPLEHDAEAAHERCLRHQLGYRLATLLLLFLRQRVGHSRHITGVNERLL